MSDRIVDALLRVTFLALLAADALAMLRML